MDRILKSKTTRLGLVELRQTSIGYAIFLDGNMREYSRDLNYILRVFENY